MNAVQSIESLASGDGQHNLFRTLGPTLLISMAYLDLGKWVVTVDAGSRFGYDLVLLVVLFNFSAILWQYLSTCIGMVTGQNLAEICRQEYSRAICAVLGLQAGVSLLTSELTMIAGVAVGFNLIFGYDDLITSICFSTVIVNLLPYTLSHLDKKVAGIFNACVAGFTLLCFVLGLLISHPKTPVNMNVMFPKLSGESAYSLMALLGANIIVHNFYTHSSMVQVQRRSSVLTLGSLFHDHLFSILFIFTGIFLVNYVLLSSAADDPGDTMSMNCEDAMELMNQIFSNPAAPIVLLVILLFSSHIISLTCIISSDVISENFFGVKLPLFANHLLPKGFAMVPTIYCAKVAGHEGIYQLLIICPVIQAMLLPSSVIPVFRVSSSRLLMDRYRISTCVEILAFLSFLLALFTNIIFAAEILFGDSTWTNNLKGNTESPVLLPYAVVVLISCASIAFTLFLAVTPLKSASNEAETQLSSVHSQRENLDRSDHREVTSLEDVRENVDWSSEDDIPRGPSEGHQKSTFEHTSRSDPNAESAHGTAQQPTAHRVVHTEVHPSSSMNREEPKSVENIKLKTGTENIVRMEADVCIQKDIEVSRDVEFEESTGGKAPSSTSDDPPPVILSRGKYTDAGNVSDSLSRVPVLSRAARRQLAAILDEFWGHLFDYHGKVTQEANTKRLDLLIGLELRTSSSAMRTDNISTEASRSHMMRGGIRRSATVLNSWDTRDIYNPDLSFGVQIGTTGSPTWSPSMHVPNRDIPNSDNTFLEQNTDLYSNCNAPSYSESQFYQPATIHGYPLANYLKGMNASRSPHSTIQMDPRSLPRPTESALPNYTDSVMHAHKQKVLGSLAADSLESPVMNRLRQMVVERSYYDPNFIGGSERVGSSSYSKKYHSSPDISAVMAASRNALLNEANLGGPAANMSYLRSPASEKSQYVDSGGRYSSQYALDESSQHNVQRDILSMHSRSMNPSTTSLWAQQPFEHSYTECETELLHAFRFCIMKLLKLEGSEWLFMQNGGCDENLINHVSGAERFSQKETSDVGDANCRRKLSDCGNGCVWRASLVVSFGVWCIHRVLDLSLAESRPELWGKYTYILNRLQGILDAAFSKPRKPLTGCACLAKTGLVAKPIPGTFTTTSVILDLIKDVEQAVSGRKGRSGTTAGNVAFPKGKENLASVLKRYKRRLSNNPSVGQ